MANTMQSIEQRFNQLNLYGDGHRLLTAHSKTERGERGHSHRQIKDPNFHNSVTEILTNSTYQSQTTLRHSTVEQDVQENINTKRHRI